MKKISSTNLNAVIRGFATTRLGIGDYTSEMLNSVMMSLRAAIDAAMTEEITDVADRAVKVFGRQGVRAALIREVKKDFPDVSDEQADVAIQGAISRSIAAQIQTTREKLRALENEQDHARTRWNQF